MFFMRSPFLIATTLSYLTYKYGLLACFFCFFLILITLSLLLPQKNEKHISKLIQVANKKVVAYYTTKFFFSNYGLI